MEDKEKLNEFQSIRKLLVDIEGSSRFSQTLLEDDGVVRNQEMLNSVLSGIMKTGLEIVDKVLKINPEMTPKLLIGEENAQNDQKTKIYETLIFLHTLNNLRSASLRLKTELAESSFSSELKDLAKVIDYSEKIFSQFSTQKSSQISNLSKKGDPGSLPALKNVSTPLLKLIPPVMTNKSIMTKEAYLNNLLMRAKPRQLDPIKIRFKILKINTWIIQNTSNCVCFSAKSENELFIAQSDSGYMAIKKDRICYEESNTEAIFGDGVYLKGHYYLSNCRKPRKIVKIKENVQPPPINHLGRGSKHTSMESQFEHILEFMANSGYGRSIRVGCDQNHLILNRNKNTLFYIDLRGIKEFAVSKEYGGNSLIDHACLGFHKVVFLNKNGLLQVNSYSNSTSLYKEFCRIDLSSGLKDSEFCHSLAVHQPSNTFFVSTRKEAEGFKKSTMRIIAVKLEISEARMLRMDMVDLSEDNLGGLMALACYGEFDGRLILTGMTFSMKESVVVTFQFYEGVLKELKELKRQVDVWIPTKLVLVKDRLVSVGSNSVKIVISYHLDKDELRRQESQERLMLKAEELITNQNKKKR